MRDDRPDRRVRGLRPPDRARDRRPAAAPPSPDHDRRLVTRGYLDRTPSSPAATPSRSRARLRRHAVRVRDVALIMYTSGTTANPKGCVITHEGDRPHGSRASWSACAAHGGRAVLGPAAALPHGAGSCCSRRSSRPAGRSSAMPHFEPACALEPSARSARTVLYPLFPTITLDAHPPPRLRRRPTPRAARLLDTSRRPTTLRAIAGRVPGGDAVERLRDHGVRRLRRLQRARRRAGARAHRRRAAGRCAGIEMRVVDPETDAALAPGERGELARPRAAGCSTATTATRSATAEVDRRRGLASTPATSAPWMRTGASPTTAASRTCSRSAARTSRPLEIEALLATHPAVKIAQVVGVPDPRYVEVPAAFVELDPGRQLRRGGADRVLRRAGSRLQGAAARALRHRVADVATKIQKHVLRESILQELGLEQPVG